MPLTTSIVLCTYNGAAFLGALWRSLLAQSRRPDEILIRDDASTDGTYALLEQLRGEAQARGIDVDLSRNPRNLGYVKNFEAALAEARGEVLFLCDQDDVWHPGKLAAMLAEFEQRPELLLLHTDARRVDAQGNDLHRDLLETLEVSRRELALIHAGRAFDVLLRRSLVTGATVALRRGLLARATPFPPEWVHDEWLAIIAAAAGEVDVIESPLIDYRQHEANQIGMRLRGTGEKFSDLLRPRTTLLATSIARLEALEVRLADMGAHVPSERSGAVAQKLEHLRVRHGMHGWPWRRIARVIRETIGGRYRRYSSGWRSAVRDLVRHG